MVLPQVVLEILKKNCRGAHNAPPPPPPILNRVKPISRKEFNEFIKGKGFKGRNEYKLKDLKAKFGFKPMYHRRTLMISSEDMSPTTFDSLRKADSSVSISYGVLIYAKYKERNFVRSNEKIYNINWHN